METYLSEIFLEERSSSIEWEGKLIHSIYEFSAQRELNIELKSFTNSIVQGFVIKVSDGVVAVNGIQKPQFIIWSDSAPKIIKVEFPVAKSPKKKLIKVWNCWKEVHSGQEVEQAWLGNAGMQVFEKTDRIDFICSDGVGSVNFKDFQFTILTCPY